MSDRETPVPTVRVGAEVVRAHEEDAHDEEPGDHGEGDPVVPHVLVGC